MNIVELLKQLPSEQSTALLGTLTYRQREILKLRTGFVDGLELTLEEVGHIFKLTEEEVREFEEEALRRIEAQIGGDPSLKISGLGKLDIFVDPGSATSEEISELLIEISSLYRMIGGSGVVFTLTDAREPVIA